MSESGQTQNGHLTIHERMSVGCSPLETEHLAETSAHIQRDSAQHLKSILTVEHLASEHRDSGSELSADLQLLESKLDVALELLCQLLSQHHQEQSLQDCQLNITGLKWWQSGPELPRDGDSVCLQLVFNFRLRRPVRLPAMINAVTATSSGYQIEALFLSMEEGLADLLEQAIFILHRREISHLRQSQAN